MLWQRRGKGARGLQDLKVAFTQRLELPVFEKKGPAKSQSQRLNYLLFLLRDMNRTIFFLLKSRNAQMREE